MQLGHLGATRLRALLAAPAAALAILIAAAPATAQSVKLAEFGGQTFSSPFYVAGDPGDPGRVFVVEGTGTIRLVENGVTQSTPFLTIPEVFLGIPGDDPCNDCGLFSMAFAPDYATSGRFYVFYTRDSPGAYYYLRIEEFRRSAADPDIADPATRRIVLEIPHLDSSIHNGGQLQFGPDGLLYISVGDGGPQADPNGNGQGKETLLGKLLRINPTGAVPGQYSIPATNPFAGDTPGADEIYAYGLRNPWRFSFDRLTGDLTIGDVGHTAWEEVDFVPRGDGRGANFGWNCFEGSQPYSNAPASCTPPPASHTPPVLEYQNPVPGAASVSGGYVIRDGALPSLLGRYIYADIYDVFGGELQTARLFAGGSDEQEGLGVGATNVVSFGEDACAHIYVATIGGTVYRLEPASGPFPCLPQTPAVGPPSQGPADPSSSADGRAPALFVGSKLARHVAKRGAVILLVSCDERCGAGGEAFVKIKGDRDRGPRRLIAREDEGVLEAGESGRLKLRLSRRERMSLLAALREGRRAVARLEVTATDGAGNESVVKRAVKQKRP